MPKPLTLNIHKEHAHLFIYAHPIIFFPFKNFYNNTKIKLKVTIRKAIIKIAVVKTHTHNDNANNNNKDSNSLPSQGKDTPATPQAQVSMPIVKE